MRLRLLVLPVCMLLAGFLPAADAAHAAAGSEILSAVVGVHAEVPGDARTADSLGTERSGTGVVIDSSGLVLTIGYLVIEAGEIELRDAAGRTAPAELVGYDHDTGFGLVRATTPLDVEPLPLGSSAGVALGAPLLVVSQASKLAAIEAKLVDRREFAGYWEYLLPNALFTAPPLPEFGGAALIDTNGRLVGIGSLLVPDANGAGIPSPGNMFVPVDALKPVLGDMLAFGRPGHPARPWIGVTTREIGGHLVIAGVSADGPAARAGVAPGDIVVGVGDSPVGKLGDFYREIWSMGEPGAVVPLRVYRSGGMVELKITSIDRLRWLKLQRSF